MKFIIRARMQNFTTEFFGPFDTRPLAGAWANDNASILVSWTVLDLQNPVSLEADRLTLEDLIV